jgi:Uma2 family endonuclease
MVRMNAIPLEREIEYPSSDGKPMAESDLHRNEMVVLIAALRRHFRNAPDGYVGGNLLLYYVEGDSRYCVAPDVFYVPGVPRGLRETFLLWKEGRPPAFVLEVTSRTTRREDLGKKKSLYEQLGVEEYFLHDPLGDYLKPHLQGYRLVKGRYEPVVLAPDGSLFSETTGLTFREEGNELRVIDPKTGQLMPTILEAEDRADKAEQRFQEAQREIERLQAELAKLRGERPD